MVSETVISKHFQKTSVILILSKGNDINLTVFNLLTWQMEHFSVKKSFLNLVVCGLVLTKLYTIHLKNF